MMNRDDWNTTVAAPENEEEALALLEQIRSRDIDTDFDGQVMGFMQFAGPSIFAVKLDENADLPYEVLRTAARDVAEKSEYLIAHLRYVFAYSEAERILGEERVREFRVAVMRGRGMPEIKPAAVRV